MKRPCCRVARAYIKYVYTGIPCCAGSATGRTRAEALNLGRAGEILQVEVKDSDIYSSRANRYLDMALMSSIAVLVSGIIDHLLVRLCTPRIAQLTQHAPYLLIKHRVRSICAVDVSPHWRPDSWATPIYQVQS